MFVFLFVGFAVPAGGFAFTGRLPVLAGRLTEIPGRLTGFSVTAFVVPVALTVFCLSASGFSGGYVLFDFHDDGHLHGPVAVDGQAVDALPRG